MSEDEVFVLLIGLGGGVILGGVWFLLVTRPTLAANQGALRASLGLAPIVASSAVLAVLLTLAADDVRTAPQYIFLYFTIGIVWVLLAGITSVFIGISARDDAVERRNPAAAIVLCAIMLAQAAVYSGANVGNGPGWWVVFFSGGLALACWIAIWFMFNAATHAAERITVGRDVPAALRIGGFLIGVGLICGRAAAGDWESALQTIVDFSAAWPALVLLGLAMVIERAVRPGGIGGTLASAGLLGAAYVGLGVLAIASSAPLSHNPAWPAPIPVQVAPSPT